LPDPKIILVIPTYNEAENLPRLVSALLLLKTPNLHLLIVDDNSPDGTGGIADDLAGAHPDGVAVLHREQKLGLGRAYLHGFRVALEMGADVVGEMDADFSHPVEKVPELVETLKSCDIALGSRYIKGGSLDEGWPVWRKMLSVFGNIYARTILRLPPRDVTGGFRLYRRETLLGMPLERVRSNGYIFQVEMLYLAHLCGFRAQEVPFHFADRKWGESKMSFWIQREAALRVWQVWWAYRDLRRRPPTR